MHAFSAAREAGSWPVKDDRQMIRIFVFFVNQNKESIIIAHRAAILTTPWSSLVHPES